MDDPTVTITEEPSYVIVAVEPVSTVIAATGSGSGGHNYFRGVINYDGGKPDSDYGDLMSLDGGGPEDGRRNSI